MKRDAFDALVQMGKERARMDNPSPDLKRYKLPTEFELDRIVTLQEAAKMSSLSPASWKRNHPDKILKLSPRRLGIRLRDVLMLKRLP